MEVHTNFPTGLDVNLDEIKKKKKKEEASLPLRACLMGMAIWIHDM